MRNEARAVLLVIAASVAGLGMPGVLSASETIDCNGTLIAKVPQPMAHLGWSVSVAGEWLAAGAIYNNMQPGSVALYRKPFSGSDQMPNQEIFADVPHPGDQFGSSVSISGDWLAVGAPMGDGKVQDSGVVYLFQLVSQAGGPKWVQAAKLEAGDATRGALFGFSVSLSGATLVVGAPTDSGGGSLAGAAYIFELPAGVSGPWNQKAKLLANDARPFDEFGSAVATDGNEIVVGSPFADDLTLFRNFGAAYVFKRVGSGWTLEDHGKLTAGPFRAGNIQFGAAVAIGEGRIVAGSPGYDNTNPNLTDSGSAYVFERQGSGWLQHQLKPEDSGEGAQFGDAVQIDSLGRVVIGARFTGVGMNRAGASYLFEKKNEAWTQKFKILHTPGGAFGQSVAILGDRVFMGGFLYDVPPGDPVTDAGAVTVCPLSPCPTSISMSRHSTVQPGQTLTYEITVKAAGPGAMVSDKFTPALEALSWCRGAGCTDFVEQPFMDTLPNGGDATYRLRGRLGATATGQLTSMAFVKGGGCPASTNNSEPISSTPPPMPELSCVKTGPVTAAGGDIVTYDIAVSNIGNAAARNVTLSDPTPAGLTLVSVSGPCTQLPCNLGTLQPGQTLPPVTAKFQVDTCPAPSSVTNLANVVGSNAPEATCSRTTVVPPEADLGVNVTAPLDVPGGNSFPVTVTVTNSGSQTAQGATVDVVITGASMIGSFPLECTQVGNQPGHFTCLLGDMPCGSKSLIFSVRAPSCVTCAAGTPIVVTADAMSQTPDPTLPNHGMATTQVTCAPMADLAITKEDSPDPVAAGNELQYTITVKNVGCLDVLGATVTDVFPARLTNVRWCREIGGPCNPSQQGNLNDTLPLAVGDSAVYLVKGTPICGGPLVNTATVSTPPGVVDINTSNNTATATTTISSQPGVSIQCSGVSGAFEGDFVTFTYVLSNGGPNAQADNPGAEFTDTLPAGLSLITVTASSGIVTTVANTVTWNGSIPVCGTVTIAVQAKVDPGTVGTTLCNQGTVAFDANGDGVNESNASALCCLKVIPDCTTTFCIPTLEPAGLAALVILLACVALLRLRRRSL